VYDNRPVKKKSLSLITVHILLRLHHFAELSKIKDPCLKSFDSL